MSEPQRDLSAAELQKALGVSRRTVGNYCAAGCPHERAGTGKRAPLCFNLEEVKAWMRATARSGEAGRPPAGAEVRPTPAAPAEKTADELDTDAAEDLVELTRRVNLEIKRVDLQKRQRLEAEAMGELVPLEQVKRAWGAQVEVVKARFRALPSLLAKRLVGKDYDEAHDLLQRELDGVLRSFAREELPVG